MQLWTLSCKIKAWSCSAYHYKDKCVSGSSSPKQAQKRRFMLSSSGFIARCPNHFQIKSIIIIQNQKDPIMSSLQTALTIANKLSWNGLGYRQALGSRFRSQKASPVAWFYLLTHSKLKVDQNFTLDYKKLKAVWNLLTLI